MLRRSILVVDDDPDLRGILQERLTSRGHRVETAENGHDALTKLDQADFDGVLLDYLMPGITGLAVLQHIRQHRPLLPVVVMMTGATGSQMAAQARAAGARACLLKPFDQGKLEQVVQCWFGTAA
jgi:CheY-like chemotaxis protein